MTVTGVTGNDKEINRGLLEHALYHPPSLIIDAANCANVHSLFPHHPSAPYDHVYVIEVELLYTFRDILKKVPELIKKFKLKSVVITSFRILFNYQDEVENRNIYRQAWQLISDIGTMCDITVGIFDDELQHVLAKHHCDIITDIGGLTMGHTVWTQHVNLEKMIAELSAYAKALRPADRELFEGLLKVPFHYVGAMSYANSIHAWAMMLLSIVIEQEKKIRYLNDHLSDRRI